MQRATAIAIAILASIVTVATGARADAPAPPPEDAAHAGALVIGAIARGDADALAARVAFPLRVWVWAPSAACRAQLDKVTIADAAALRAILPCLAELDLTLEPPTATDTRFATALAAPGVAVTLELTPGDDGVLRLAMLVSPPHAGDPAIPLVRRDVLEVHRIHGSPVIAASAAVRAEAAADPTHHVTSRYQVCVDVAGKVSSISNLHGSAAYFADVTAAAKPWSFKPFLRKGKAVPVCAVLQTWFPDDLGVDGQPAASGSRPAVVSPNVLNAQRISGDPQIVPDDATKGAMMAAHVHRTVASAKLCIDKAGAVAAVEIVKASGFPAYDQELEDHIKTWKYRPFVIDGTPVVACTAVTFIYQMHYDDPPPGGSAAP